MSDVCNRCGRPKAVKREFVAGACLYETGDELDAMICDVAAAAYQRGRVDAIADMERALAKVLPWMNEVTR